MLVVVVVKVFLSMFILIVVGVLIASVFLVVVVGFRQLLGYCGACCGGRVFVAVVTAVERVVVGLRSALFTCKPECGICGFGCGCGGSSCGGGFALAHNHQCHHHHCYHHQWWWWW